MRKVAVTLFVLVLMVSALIQPWMNVSGYPEGESEEEIIKKILEDTAKDLGWPLDGLDKYELQRFGKEVPGGYELLGWIKIQPFDSADTAREYFEDYAKRTREDTWQKYYHVKDTSFHGYPAQILIRGYEEYDILNFASMVWACGTYLFWIHQDGGFKFNEVYVESWAEIFWENVQAYGLLEAVQDLVFITSLEPKQYSTLSLGQKYSFKATIDYTLASDTTAHIFLHIRDQSDNVLSYASIDVDRGSGRVQLTVECTIPKEATLIMVHVDLYEPFGPTYASHVIEFLVEDTLPPDISEISFTVHDFEMDYFILGCDFKVSALVRDDSGVKQVHAFIAPWDNPSPDDLSAIFFMILSDPDGDDYWTISNTLPSSYEDLTPGENYALYIRAWDLLDNIIRVRLDRKITIQAKAVARIEHTKGIVKITEAHWRHKRDEREKNLLYQGDKVTLGSSPYNKEGGDIHEIKIYWFEEQVRGIARLDEKKTDVYFDDFTIGPTRGASDWPIPLHNVLWSGAEKGVKCGIGWLLKTLSKKAFLPFKVVLYTLETKGKQPIVFINVKSEVLIEPQPDGTVRILALEGAPEIFYDYGNSKITLSPGEMTVINEYDVPSEPATFDPITIEKWWETEYEVPTLAEYVLGKGERENMQPIEETRIFLISDDEVRLWLRFTNVYESHEIVAEWYDPDRNFHGSTISAIEQPPEGNYWEEYNLLLNMPIKDEDAAEKPGRWNVVVYLNDEALLSTNFDITQALYSAQLTNIDAPLKIGKGKNLIITLTISYDFPFPTEVSPGIYDYDTDQWIAEEFEILDGKDTKTYRFNLNAPSEEKTWKLEANVMYNVEGEWMHNELGWSEVFDVKVIGGCLIATATYGSELAQDVQFLRDFRDEIVLSTFAGNRFMELFNTWYYSFSPTVASFIARHPIARESMKVLLYPLIGALQLSSATFKVLSFNKEFGVVMAGLVASALIGAVYFSPLTMMTVMALKRRRSLPKVNQLRPFLFGWLISVGLICLGEITTSSALLMAGTGSFVIFTIALTAGFLTLKSINFNKNKKI